MHCSSILNFSITDHTKKMAKSNSSYSREAGKSLEGSLDEVAGSLPSGLKPKLDKIFAEVEEKLPDIDFDASDSDVSLFCMNKSITLGFIS